MNTIIPIVLLLLFLLIGMPVAFALAIAGALGLYMILGFGGMFGVLSSAPFTNVTSYELITVPMFLVMAELIIVSKLMDRVFIAAVTLIGRLRGGLAMATALAGALFGAISGSSTASAATLSATTIPLMREAGYDDEIASGAVVISGTLAMLVPPSIALILYGFIADVSIGKLLIAGIIPGLLVTLAIMLTIAILGLIKPESIPHGKKYTIREKIGSLKHLTAVVILFGVVMGCIYLGITTPTEASAIGMIGALFIAIMSKYTTRGKIEKAIKRGLITTCMIMTIVLGAAIFGYYIALSDLTQQLISILVESNTNRWVLLMGVIGLLIVLGCLMDQVAILFLTAPTLVPLMVQYDFDLVWFGVIMVIVGELGMITPPVGLNAFVVAKYAQIDLADIFKGSVPHIIGHLLVVALLIAVPGIITWLPGRM